MSSLKNAAVCWLQEWLKEQVRELPHFQPLQQLLEADGFSLISEVEPPGLGNASPSANTAKEEAGHADDDVESAR